MKTTMRFLMGALAALAIFGAMRATIGTRVEPEAVEQTRPTMADFNQNLLTIEYHATNEAR